MVLAITIYWIAAVTVMLCLFGGACIGLAIMAREGSVRAANGETERTCPKTNGSSRRLAKFRPTVRRF